ncbi:MAG: penicillin acylase family protein [Saprospiraceae bacterium]|nr:penicillin acylase family protein [Saprospiraceae bacterium]
MKQSLLLLLVFFAACTAPRHASEPARWQAQADRITIFRDDFGIPHIYGKTDADAVFGMLYAQCEDDFNRVERNYIVAIGRLAEVEGEKELYSDLRARLFMTEDEAKAHYESAPKWLKKLCIAFSDGINYYLHTHPEVKPKLLTHFEPWFPMYFFEGSIGGDIESISTEGIEAFYWGRASVGMNGSQLRNADYGLRIDDDEPRGSNGIALSGKMTASGHAMLLINPHTSFYFRPEIHVVSEEGLNVYGAVTWGQFFVYQGFNEKTGWMHTSSYTDVMDEFVETVTEDYEQITYNYGSEKRPIIVKHVTLKYKDSNAIKERKFPIYRTHHGPITRKIEAGELNDYTDFTQKWVATAMMWDPVKALTQSFTRTKLKNHRQFRKMMNLRTNSSNSTVFADAEGNIAFFHGNFVPKRDTTFDYLKPVDGSNPATDWQGLHDVKDCIVVANPPNGWLQNCNSTPFTCAGENSPKAKDYPEYMRLPAENFRGIHAVRLLKERRDFTLDKLIETAYDPQLPGFEKLIPGLLEAYDDDAEGAKFIPGPVYDVLNKWDFRVSKESVAMTLAHYYAKQYEKHGKLPDNLDYEYLGDMAKFNYFGTGSPAAERLTIFKDALAQLIADFGRWDVPWGEVNRFQRLTGDIVQPFDDSKPSLACGMASAKWGALASFGAKTYKGSKRIYGTSGNSFVAVVEFGPKLKAKSLLAGGESGDPKSPHFYDQAQRYVDRQFKDVAFYREDVERRAKRRYKPGE